MVIRRPARTEWLRAHGDELFAGLFTVSWLTGIVGGPVPHAGWRLAGFAVFGALITVPLAWRRRAPVLVALVVYCAGTALAYSLSADLPIGFVVASLLAAYSLGAHSQARRSWVTLVIVVVIIGIGNLPHNDAGAAGVILTPAAFVLVPWGVGGLVARLRAERGHLHALTVKLEAEQIEVARASVLDERARIARELHDIVAHSISVMVVQAGAAEQFIDPSNRARAPLAAIRTTGQQAMIEMRHLLGVLRTDYPSPPALSPQPGMSNLDLLLEAARDPGLRIEVSILGEQAALPPGVDVAAYRVVQESFSNIRKHARASLAALTVDYQPTCLTIDVVDDGVGGPAQVLQAGHGVIGMRERVSLYGGNLECGPRPSGGWRVCARLPLTP